MNSREATDIVRAENGNYVKPCACTATLGVVDVTGKAQHCVACDYLSKKKLATLGAICAWQHQADSSSQRTTDLGHSTSRRMDSASTRTYTSKCKAC